MSFDPEMRQIVLLRVLGVLLILVGFSMLTRSVRSDTPVIASIENMLLQDDHRHRHTFRTSCEEVHVQIHVPDAPVPPPPASF